MVVIMPLSPANIEAVNNFVNMSEEDYNEMKNANPLITSTVDQLRKLFT